MTYQPTVPFDAAAMAAHSSLIGHADTALPDSPADSWIGYESCHPLTWLPGSEPEACAA